MYVTFNMKAHILTLLTLAFLITLSSCSKTIFTGDSNSLLSVPLNQKIVFLDFTGLDLSNDHPAYFNHVHGSDLLFVHTFCINYDRKGIQEKCVKQFDSLYNASHLVVCRTNTLHEGKSIHHVTDYEARVNAQRDAGHNIEPAQPISSPVPETNNMGVVLFDIYETGTGTMVNSFGISVRNSGISIRNKKDYGYTNYNLVPAEQTLVKARRKGLENIKKRIIINN